MKRLMLRQSNVFCLLIALAFWAGAIVLFNFATYLCAGIFLLFAILFTAAVFYKDDGLLKLEIEGSRIRFFEYSMKKLIVKEFEFCDIESFELSISSFVDYAKVVSKNSPPVDLTFKIISSKVGECVMLARLPATTSITKVFDVIKEVPNFKYNVQTNSEIFQVSIDRYAQAKEKIGFIKSIKTILNDPQVPTMNKDVYKVLIYILMFQAIVIISMIISIIADLF